MPRNWILFNYNNNGPTNVPHLDKQKTIDAISFSKYDTRTIAQQAYHYTFKYQ